MSAYQDLKTQMRSAPEKWLITGVGGFIGSNLLEVLLRHDQMVRGIDNFSTGKRRNLEHVRGMVSSAQWERFEFLEGDIRSIEACGAACKGVRYVLHQAALGSVPRSMEDPLSSHASNVDGFFNMLLAAREAGVSRFVYASSSAVYGDHPALPKIEDQTGTPLSPYAATKVINEIYSRTFARAFSFLPVGLRYFNVFGPRQDPEGAYAAVIPKWVAALLKGETVFINGDGESSRDFCYIENVVQANLLAATTRNHEALNQAYNIALGERTTLNELFGMIQATLRKFRPDLPDRKPVYRDFRPGDVRHSLADISRAKRLLGYEPTHRIQAGLELAMQWYCQSLAT